MSIMPVNQAALKRLIDEYGRLQRLEGCTPQSRGQRFNGLIAEFLQCHGIDARANHQSAGEIDVLFTVDGVNHVLEAKWLSPKVDTGDIAKLQKRVRQRLAGTCGVLLSMSGYSPDALRDVKDGERLEIILLDRAHWEAMLSDQVPPAKMFALARSRAAFQGDAYSPLPDLLESSLPVPTFNFGSQGSAAWRASSTTTRAGRVSSSSSTRG